MLDFVKDDESDKPEVSAEEAAYVKAENFKIDMFINPKRVDELKNETHT